MITIRIATADDTDALVELRRLWTAENSGERIDLNDGFDVVFAEWFAANAHRRTFWIAFDDDRPIGMVNLTTFDRMPSPGQPSGGWGYLGQMFTVPQARSRGVGAQLIKALLAHADDVGMERVVLNPSERSRPFYARHGFGAANQLLLRLPPSRGE